MSVLVTARLEEAEVQLLNMVLTQLSILSRELKLIDEHTMKFRRLVQLVTNSLQ